MKLLIPGGAGYIGSHMVRHAQDHGHEVVVLDNFSTGHKWAVRHCEILHVNLLDQDKLSQLLKGRHFDGVIHFAAKSLVSESVKKPYLYYRNNVVGTLNLVNEMLKNNVNDLVFSSTAAIFGNPLTEKIAEDHPKNPVNPYGQSKLMVENMLQDICSANNLNVTCLRYFNAAGAHESGEIGEAHDPETHLIPNVLKGTLLNKSNLKVFGDDYPSPDGTCVRDYVHVTDLAQAHLLGLEYMQKNKGFSCFNLGNGNGFSVLEVIKSCNEILKTDINYEIDKRREGDPATLVAENERAHKLLEWRPVNSSLDVIISSAYKWHKMQVKR
ncbi:UDP-glucose 4-epimerase GalE [Gammaproteobacteria bacterium]|nr:UDP-glucose 4-epimerase GalE [Gammaproteobacteria bacterium]